MLQHGGVGEHRAGVNEKIQKILVIAVSDAADDPWAVVIHSQEARVAHAAVMCTRRLLFVAFAAP
jgi:hypothetical protein